jgi:hypothetical protein
MADFIPGAYPVYDQYFKNANQYVAQQCTGRRGGIDAAGSFRYNSVVQLFGGFYGVGLPVVNQAHLWIFGH